MKILISPSKTISSNNEISCAKYTKPHFFNDAIELVKILKKYNQQDISKLMNISDNLSKLNYERYQNFDSNPNSKNSKQAILIFKGDVYDPIEIDNYNNNDFDFIQQSLRIISGLYGILKPLDLIKPYRLEMSTKLSNSRGEDLYNFWSDSLINFLNNETNEDEEIVNLASNEYFRAINTKKSKRKIINIDFKEKRSNAYKNIGIYAKRARGEMVNYIVKNKITNYKDLKKFNIDNYQFNESLSLDYSYCFTR